MAVNEVTYINAGKPKMGGAIFTAPPGTPLPTDSVAALDEAFKCVGYVTDDGVNNNITRNTTDIKAWGGDTVLRLQNDFTDEFGFTLLQANDPDVMAAVFGSDNVSGTPTAGMTLKVNSSAVPAQSWIIDTVLQNGTKRLVIPHGTPVMSGAVEYVDDAAVAYPLTVGALPDTDGNTHYEYTKTI